MAVARTATRVRMPILYQSKRFMIKMASVVTLRLWYFHEKGSQIPFSHEIHLERVFSLQSQQNKKTPSVQSTLVLKCGSVAAFYIDLY